MWHKGTPKRLSKESTSHEAPNVSSKNVTGLHTKTPKRLSKENASHGAPNVSSIQKRKQLHITTPKRLSKEQAMEHLT